ATLAAKAVRMFSRLSSATPHTILKRMTAYLTVLTAFDSSAPVQSSASLLIDASGQRSNAINGSNVDAQIASDLLEHAKSVRSYPISDKDAQRAELSCNKIAHMLLAELNDTHQNTYKRKKRARANRRAHMLVQRLNGAASTTLFVDNA